MIKCRPDFASIYLLVNYERVVAYCLLNKRNKNCMATSAESTLTKRQYMHAAALPLGWSFSYETKFGAAQQLSVVFE